MNKQIRVLHVLGSMNLAGMESRIMDIYRHIDRTLVQFDFLELSEARAFFDDEIEALGGTIYHMDCPRKITKRQALAKQIAALCRDQGYETAHMHLSEATITAVLLLRALRAANVSRRIVHARSAMCEPIALKKHTVFRPWIKALASDFVAVSKPAAIYMFGEGAYRRGRVMTIKNAIDIYKFRYDRPAGLALRQALRVPEDAYVVGHVGRFNVVKNHTFLLEVFSGILRRRPESYLLLVGDGALRPEIQARAQDMQIADRVIFAGNQANPSAFYSAMDMFCFPSFFEGLPGVVLEAQAAGLPCLISDGITEEVVILPQTLRMALSEGSERWTETALAIQEPDREASFHVMQASGFDIRDVSAQWEAYYRQRD